MPIPKEAGTLGMPSKASKAVVGGHGTGRGACGHRHGNGRRRRDAFGAIWPCFGRELDPTSPNQGQKALAVGPEYYENGAVPGAGYRNGSRRGRLRTAEGAIEYGVPQVADRAEPFGFARARADRPDGPNWNAWPSRCSRAA